MRGVYAAAGAAGGEGHVRPERHLLEVLDREVRQLHGHLEGSGGWLRVLARSPAVWSSRLHSTGHGVAPQTSAAYSAIVRSLENLPECATLRAAFRAQASGRW